MAAAASVEETVGDQMKYILVTGGVISGIGKGIIASSMGALLKAVGFRVTSIKIDPYINIDAGTFSPYEHGEVFVLDDGGEVDLDLGNYERYLDVTLHRDNNITTGKIYQQVISDERAGRYLGKTVQVVPHVTDAIMAWVERVARVPVEHADGPDDVRAPEICIIELGGTIGDIEGMPFVEAFRQFQFRVGRENFCCVHVSLVPQPSSTGEQKTKPTQASVRELRGLGLYPDIVACRSEKPIGPEVKAKLSNFCHVAKEQVICLHDVHSLYSVPSMLAEEGCLDTLCKRLQLQLRSDLRLRRCLAPWRLLAERQSHVRQSVSIALVGKYTQLKDSYASVIKALEHAALRANRRLQLVCIEAEHLEEGVVEPAKYYEAWRQLVDTQGVLVPGGFGSRGAHGKMAAIRWARTHRRPFLGVCLGMQLAVVEFARAQLGLAGANSTEFDPEPADRLVVDMPEHNPGQMGGTMRLGRRTTRLITDDSLLRRLYGGAELVHERHRHRYEVNPEYVQRLEAAGMRFVGQGQDDGAGNKRMEVLELQGHPFFIGVQFHPEYLTRPDRPSPPYLGLLMASCGKLGVFLNRGCRLSPPRMRRESIGDTSDDEDQLVYKIAASCVTPVSEIESPTTDEPTNRGDGSAIVNVK